jgi:hypothetical protein
MESTPVSRASFGTRCGGMRLQSCPRTLSLDAVGLVFLFLPLPSDRVKEPFQALFLCFNEDSYGMALKSISNRRNRSETLRLLLARGNSVRGPWSSLFKKVVKPLPDTNY